MVSICRCLERAFVRFTAEVVDVCCLHVSFCCTNVLCKQVLNWHSTGKWQWLSNALHDILSDAPLGGGTAGGSVDGTPPGEAAALPDAAADPGARLTVYLAFPEDNSRFGSFRGFRKLCQRGVKIVLRSCSSRDCVTSWHQQQSPSVELTKGVDLGGAAADLRGRPRQLTPAGT